MNNFGLKLNQISTDITKRGDKFRAKSLIPSEDYVPGTLDEKERLEILSLYDENDGKWKHRATLSLRTKIEFPMGREPKSRSALEKEHENILLKIEDIVSMLEMLYDITQN